MFFGVKEKPLIYSRQQQQRFNKRNKKEKQKNQERQHKEILEHQFLTESEIENVQKNVERQFAHSYSFLADTNKTAFTNASQIMGEYPLWYYFSRTNTSHCHDFTTFLTPPRHFKSLLGLRLNFCPSPRSSTNNLKHTFKRFKHSLYWKNIIGDQPDNTFDPRYHVRSHNNPDVHQVDIDLWHRTVEFFAGMNQLFVKKRACPNLL